MFSLKTIIIAVIVIFILFLINGACVAKSVEEISDDEKGTKCREHNFIKRLINVDKRNHCAVISNVSIPYTDNCADLLFIHGSGIYVIKVEDHFSKGAFKMMEEGWMDIYDYGYQENPYMIDDPIVKNKIIVDSLRRVVPDKIPIYSIVVFISNNYFGDVEFGTYTKVVNESDIAAALTFPMDSEMFLSPAQITAFTNKIAENGNIEYKR